LERAANLSPDAMRRGRRALAAARLKFEAGAPDTAERLLAAAATAPLEELDHARAERLRAQIAFARTRASDTPSLLSAAARLLEPVDPESARLHPGTPPRRGQEAVTAGLRPVGELEEVLGAVLERGGRSATEPQHDAPSPRRAAATPSPRAGGSRGNR